MSLREPEKAEAVTALLPPDMLRALDAFLTTEALALDASIASRSDAVRTILRDWLVGHGYLRHREDPEGAN